MAPGLLFLAVVVSLLSGSASADFSPPPPPSPPPSTLYCFSAIVSGDVSSITSAIETEIKNKVAASLSGVSSDDVQLTVNAAIDGGVISFAVTTTYAAEAVRTINSLTSNTSDASTFLTTANYTATVESFIAEKACGSDDAQASWSDGLWSGLGLLGCMLDLYCCARWLFKGNNEKKKVSAAQAQGQVSADGGDSAAEPVPMAEPVMAELVTSSMNPDDPSAPMATAVPVVTA